MTRWRLALLVLALAIQAPLAELRAQDGSDLVRQALAAYRALEYGRAASLLRDGLTRSGPGSVPDSARATAYVYLGASEMFRRRPDSAMAAFRMALVADPSHRPDALIFPPNVTDAFERARAETQVVRIDPPSAIPPGNDELMLRLRASAPHEIRVDLVSRSGSARTLYRGPIEDSLDVRWRGLAADAARRADGALAIRVFSGDSGRAMEVPVQLTVIALDTLRPPPPPADSLFFPETALGSPGFSVMIAGLATGLATALLPGAIAGGDREVGKVPAVAGAALSLGGVVAYLTNRPGRPIARNVAANEALRSAWQVEADAVRRENDRRRAAARVAVTLGRPRMVKVDR